MSSGAPDGMIPAALVARLLRDVWDLLEVKVVLAASILGAESAPVLEHDILAHEALGRGARADGSDLSTGRRVASSARSSPR